MTDKPIVEYVCMDCGAKFPAVQGSLRRYCDLCTGKRVGAGKKIKKPRKKDAT